eukprot:TRINITY_DN623_c0_g1::TRINITY_DN623_c0_g1_i2::g.28890::m.28890 TRINITY_DN623_c0_g1::TRINITY_DN623_c0_g1_i2::g.28890  ORF type:complete len:247 (-),score=41.59,bZIP_2/PF07716.10/3.1e+02,bZIP_2/PF07716.10/6.2e-05,bZIP_1/PF00170.16/2e+03,bZIP_1/PF00170.16/0.0026 TRINITY_DN623_c0_g1_i2:234-974(-)
MDLIEDQLFVDPSFPIEDNAFAFPVELDTSDLFFDQVDICPGEDEPQVLAFTAPGEAGGLQLSVGGTMLTLDASQHPPSSSEALERRRARNMAQFERETLNPVPSHNHLCFPMPIPTYTSSQSHTTTLELPPLITSPSMSYLPSTPSAFDALAPVSAIKRRTRRDTMHLTSEEKKKQRQVNNRISAQKHRERKKLELDHAASIAAHYQSRCQLLESLLMQHGVAFPPEEPLPVLLPDMMMESLPMF